MPTDKSKTCMVPSCKAVNTNVSNRIFFTVPENKKIQWLEIVGGDNRTIEPNKRLFCCENHFNVLLLSSIIISFSDNKHSFRFVRLNET